MSNVSRMIIVLVLASALFWGFSAQAAEQVSGKTFYTAANIWYESKGIQIDSANYHMGAFLPIGTNVKIIEVYDGMTTHENPLGAPVFERFIRFEDEAGRPTSLSSCRSMRERA